jgi:hypothetical protein
LGLDIKEISKDLDLNLHKINVAPRVALPKLDERRTTNQRGPDQSICSQINDKTNEAL